MSKLKKHSVIPVFLPMLACPHRCIYCNQFVISGQAKLPSEDDVKSLIDKYLITIPEDFDKRIAFFGGSFTCLPKAVQNRYLSIARPYLEKGLVNGIQLSTRPDYINDEILSNLQNFGVTLVELGAQSLDDDVLRLCERGHTVECVKQASQVIVDHGVELGLQMMIGLPLDSKEKSLKTARLIHEFGAKYTRIYPTLVVDNTKLAEMFRSGEYSPLKIEDAVDWCKALYQYFTSVDITILRMGLHPTKDLMAGDNLLGGPFHPSFKELVLTAVWCDRIEAMLAGDRQGELVLSVPREEINYAIGFNSSNRKKFPNVVFKCAEL